MGVQRCGVIDDEADLSSVQTCQQSLVRGPLGGELGDIRPLPCGQDRLPAAGLVDRGVRTRGLEL